MPQSISVQSSGKRWFSLAVLAFPTLLVSMDGTVTYLALPKISHALHPSASEFLWITDMYTFLEGGLLIIMGTLGDRVGRKKLLTIGFVLFALASVIAAYASSSIQLIAARAVLGATGAIILPCTLSLIRNLFEDPKERATAFGIYTACYSGGTMLGPLIGGALLSYFWWGSVFLISVPLMILFLLASPLLPEYKDQNAAKFQPGIAAIFLAGILMITFGFKKIAETGTAHYFFILSIAAGIALLYVFLSREKKSSTPLIDFTLFRRPSFSATLLMLFISLFIWSGLYLFVTQHLQLVLRLTPMTAGLMTLLPAIVTMIGCMTAPQVFKKIDRNAIIIAGGVIMIIGTLILSVLKIDSGLPMIIIASTALSLGCGFIVTIGIDTVVSLAPQEQAGAASGISETSTTFGSACGIAILGSIGAALFRTNFQTSYQPEDALSPDASSTLNDALTTAAQMAPEISTSIIRKANNAFIGSFHAAAFTATAAMILAIILFFTSSREKKN